MRKTEKTRQRERKTSSKKRKRNIIANNKVYKPTTISLSIKKEEV
jgi:hypothetical protein